MTSFDWTWGAAPDMMLQQAKDAHVVARLGERVQDIVTETGWRRQSLKTGHLSLLPSPSYSTSL